MEKVKIGMVGVGAISCCGSTNTFHDLELWAVCDLIEERAKQAQNKYHVPKRYDTMEELFADPEIDIVLNLTRPYEHFDVSMAAIQAGKHVYSEKPLGATLRGRKAACGGGRGKRSFSGQP